MSASNNYNSNWKKPKLIKSVIAAAAVLLAFGGFFMSGQKGYSENSGKNGKDVKKGPAYVETAKPQYKEISDRLTSVGTLMSNESVTIASEIAGKVTGIYFKEGQDVKAGQTLVRLDDSVLKATLDSASVNRDLTLTKYKRAEALLQANGMSQQDRDTAYADWQSAEAAVRLAKAQLNKAYLKAPFNGTAGLRQISMGAYIQPGTAIVNLEDVSRLKIQFNIPQTDASKIRSSETFSITTDEFPDRQFFGRIYAVNPRIDESSRSLAVRGIIDNKDRLLRPGLFAQVSIATGRPEKALFIPEAAVNLTAGGKTALILEKGVAVQKKITTGRRILGFVEITDGIGPQDVVIVKGQVKDGDKAIPAGRPEQAN